MPYLIDGHNLIPKIPGLSLQALDDENLLIELLQDFCRMQRKPVEVYFDNAPVGQAGIQRFGQVVAHFVRQGSTADAAISQRLARLGKAAVNWTVVSSDGAVQLSARVAHALVMSSENFSRLLQQSATVSASEVGENRPEGLSPDELDEWLKLFSQGSDSKH
jgi:uncharacterized protein